MIIAQITDFHVSRPGDFIDQNNKTAEHLARAVDHINNLKPVPDVVLATGDLVNEGSIEEYERLRDLLLPLTAPFLMIPGNHDDRTNLRQVFPDHKYLGKDPGFIQYTIEDYPLRLVGLDTLIPGSPNGELCAERCQWLDDQLSEKPDTPTIVFLHHPPFRTGLWHMDSMGMEKPEEFAEVIARHGQVVRVICGHIHRPITTQFAGTVLTVAPGTAHQIDLCLSDACRLAVVHEPPCCLLHCWFPDHGLITHTSYIGDYGEPIVLTEGKTPFSSH